MKLLCASLLLSAITFTNVIYGNIEKKTGLEIPVEYEAMLKEIDQEAACQEILMRIPEVPTSKRLKSVIKEKWQPILDNFLKDIYQDPTLDVRFEALELLSKRILSLSEMDDEAMQVIFELLRGNYNEKGELIKTPLTKKEFIGAILIHLPNAKIKGKDLVAAYKLVDRDPAALLEAATDGTITYSMLQRGKPKKVVN